VYLDPGTIIGITIALAGACFVMVVGLRRSTQLERVIRIKNRRIIELEAELDKNKRKERV
jgi:hypothetical protein